VKIEGDYHSDGAVVVRGLLDDNHLTKVRSALILAEAQHSPMASDLSESNDGFFLNDFNTWRKNEHIKYIIHSEPMKSVATQVVGTPSLRLFHDHILIKRGQSKPTPWHQDRPYYFVEGPKNFSI